MLKKEFLEQIEALPEIDKDQPRFTWARNRYEFHEHIKNDDIDNFLNWSTIRGAIFVGGAKHVEEKYNYLLERGLLRRYRPGLKEHKLGNPERLSYDGRTSGNLVNQVYHLSRWEDVYSKRIEDTDIIVEFGGGYGAMCAIAHRLGFKGEYHLYDLPEFSLLQRYYLSNIDIDDGNIKYHMVDDLGRFAVPPQDSDLLIACYSLSEAPADIRKPFIDSTYAKYILIAHQPIFMQEDLTEYFDSYMKSRESMYDWLVMNDETSKSCRYVLGRRI